MAEHCFYCCQSIRWCDCDIVAEHQSLETAEGPHPLDLMTPAEIDELAAVVEAALMAENGIRSY